LTISLGWFVLGGQLRLRHRRPVQATARPRRTVRSLPPRDSPQSQPIHRSRRRPRPSPSVERSPHRDHHNVGPPVCKSSDVAACRVRRDAGQAVAEPVSPTHRRIHDRTLWRPPAQIRRPGEMAVPVIRRESSHHAPDRPPSPHLRTVTLHVVRQHLCCGCRDLVHRSRHGVLHRDCGCRDILVRVSVPNAGIDRSPTSQRQWDNSGIIGGPVSVQRHLTRLRRSKEHPEIAGEAVSAQSLLAHVRHLDGRTAGDHFGIPHCLRYHATPVVLGGFVVPRRVRHSQYVYEGRTPNHHSTSSGRPSFREHEAETGPRDSDARACSSAPAYHRGREPSATSTSRRSRIASSCAEPGSPSETEHG